MKSSRFFVFCLTVVLALGVMPGIIKAEEFKIAVVQIDQDDPQAYQPLAKHLARRGVAVKLVEVQSYELATKLFTEGQVDAMLSGSGIPGSMFVIHRLKLKQALAGYKPKATRVQQAKISN